MSDPIIDRLDQIKSRAEKATPAPWAPIWEEGDDWWVVYGAPHYDGGRYLLCPEVATIEGDSSGSDDARFISEARTDVPQMEQALRAVLERCDRAISFPIPDGEMRQVCIAMRETAEIIRDEIASALAVETEGGEK